MFATHRRLILPWLHQTGYGRWVFLGVDRHRPSRVSRREPVSKYVYIQWQQHNPIVFPVIYLQHFTGGQQPEMVSLFYRQPSGYNVHGFKQFGQGKSGCCERICCNQSSTLGKHNCWRRIATACCSGFSYFIGCTGHTS